MKTPARTLAAFAAGALLTLVCTGCSPEARKTRHLQAADRFYAAGELDKAEVEYLNVLKADEKNVHAMSRLGQLYVDQGRMARAAVFLVRAHDLQPDDLDLRVKYGQLNLGAGRAKEARDEANYVLDRRPQDAEAPLLLAGTITQAKDIDELRQRLQGLPAPAPSGAPVLTALGVLQLRAGHAEEAEALFKQALSADPKFAAAAAGLGTLALAKNDRNAAEQYLRQAAENSPLRSVRRIQYAQLKLRTGDPAGARRMLEELAQKIPDYVPAWTALAEIALADKQLDDSAGFLTKALNRDPDTFEALFLRGQLRLAQGDNAKAVAEFEKLAGTYKQIPRVHFELARAYVAAGDVNKALDSVSRAVNLAPGFADAVMLQAELQMRTGDASTAIAQLRRLLQARPDNPGARMLLANALRAQGNLDDAVAVYRQLETQAPQNPQIPLMRGLVLAQQRKFDEARQAFQRAAELKPDEPLIAEQQITLDLIEKKYPEARARAEALLAKNPQQAATVQLLYAKIFLAQKDTAQAEAALKKAIELKPDVPTAYFMLAGLYLSAHEQEKALANLQEVVTRNPKDTAALTLTGVIQEQRKDYAAARAAYEKLLAGAPNSFVALNNLAWLYAERFDLVDKGYDLAERARTLQPVEPHATDTLGWILYRKHQYARARGLLQEAAEKLASSSAVQYHLGMAQYMMGEEQAARVALQRALQGGADFEGAGDAKQALAVLDTDATQGTAAARATLEQAVAERKDDPVALARLGGLHEREGNAAKAIESFEAALQINPSNVNVLVSLARLQAAAKNSAKAMELAKAARRLAPDDAGIAHTLGKLAYQAGDYAWAASLLQEAARKQSSSPDLLFDLARASYSVGRVDEAQESLRELAKSSATFLRADEAKRFLDLLELAAKPAEAAQQAARVEQILKSEPDYAPGLMAWGVICEQRRDAGAARQAYEKLVTAYPDFAPAKRRIAVLAAAQTSFDQKAFDWAAQARSVYPGDAELAKALGILNYRKSDYTRAAALLRESTTVRSDDAEAFYYLGLAQVGLKQAAAKQSLQRALDLNLRPDLAAEARKAIADLK